MKERIAEATNPNCVQIDFESVLESKIPSVKRKLPKFVISYLKKIFHEDDINYIFRTYGHLYGADFAEAIMTDYFKTPMILKGEENLPSDGRIIFACNHPLGGLDGIALLSILGQRYKGMKVPVNDLLMYIDNLKENFIPVNIIQGKGQSKNISTLINEACESDNAILFFPAGVCSRRQKDGNIRDNEWKKTFVTKAKEYQRNIVPLHFEGHNSKFFYNLAYYRTKLGVKANIEMLYLVNELFKQKGNTFTITVGKPIPYTTLDDSKSDKEWAEEIKQQSYSLIKQK